MFILRDFRCGQCGSEFEELVRSSELSIGCASCGSRAYNTIRKIAVHGCDSFNPHYDEQVGQYFETAEHKRKVLKALGKEQMSGPLSPKKSNKTSIKMTLGQAHKFDPSMKARMPKHI